jgi:membrane-associated phospholipid phosphatase
MGQTRPASEERGEPAGGPLLSPGARPLAAMVVAACAGTTALLGIWLGHGAHTDPVDTAVDSKVRAGLAGHPKLLELLARPGDLPAIAGITAILVLACLLRRRYRGAALVALSIPAAAVITERLLKPLVGRTALGFLSFPSGHATGTFALATAIAVLLAGAPALPRAVRLAAVVIAFAIASVVAGAMIALGFHYFTDAIAGAAVGAGTVLATALVIDLAVQAWRRSGRPPPPAVSKEDRPGEAGAEGSATRRANAAQAASLASLARVRKRIDEYLT